MSFHGTWLVVLSKLVPSFFDVLVQQDDGFAEEVEKVLVTVLEFVEALTQRVAVDACMLVELCSCSRVL